MSNGLRKKHTCLVCGRKFPEGQGVVISYGDLVLTFHSNKCASKFFRLLLERVPVKELKGYISRIIEELKERQEVTAKARAKRI